MSHTAEHLGIGIDAGGTFTDGAVVDLRHHRVLSKYKTPTTKDDLPGSIHKCLDGLDSDLLKRVVLVSLSTTFATNAVVEGKGAPAGVLLLGYDEYDLARLDAECKIAIRGRYDIRGRELEPLDEAAVREAVSDMVASGHVHALAISGMCSVLNPAHEIRARAIAREITDIPVVCGHDLSMELNAINRATTAYHNARLLPVVVDLIRAVEGELRRRGVFAPLKVVRSDGTLMSSADALTRPIHTILSGPAASAIGALYLSGLSDAVVVDIGGTTTDILFAESRGVRLTSGGSVVNGLPLSIPSVANHTFGLGGDSYIRRNSHGKVAIGPERVVPLCVAADVSPSVVTEMRRLSNLRTSSLCQPADFFALGWSRPPANLAEGEKSLLKALSNGPKSSVALAQATGCPHPFLLPVERLESIGAVMRCGLTPTDILHSQEVFSRWNAEAARLGVRLYARDMGISEDELCRRVMEQVADSVARELLVAALSAGSHSLKCSEFADAILANNSPYAQVHAIFTKPVVGIGAPIASYLPPACQRLSVVPVIPEHAEVANAVGAIAGRIAVSMRATVAQSGIGVYAVHTPSECVEFRALSEAEEYGEKRIRSLLAARVKEDYDGFKFRYSIRTDRRTAKTPDGEVLVESVVTGTAVCVSVPVRSEH